jgi:propionyl-CoA carboxylase alpha chain
MTKAIDEYVSTGVETTLAFCKYTINHEKFKDTTFDTNFVKNYFSNPSVLDNFDPEEEKVAAMFAALLFDVLNVGNQASNSGTSKSSWKSNRAQMN